MFELVIESGNGLIQFISKHPNLNDGKEGLNIDNVIGRFAINILCSVGFGIDTKSYEREQSLYDKMIYEIEEHGLGFLKIYKELVLGGIIFPARQTNDHVRKIFKASMLKTIDYRINNGIRRNDFLNILMDVREELAKGTKPELKNILTDDIFFFQCFVFIVAGFSGSSSILVYTLYQLALNPTIQKTLRDEVMELVTKGDEKLTYDGLHECRFLDKVITEVLRLYSHGGNGIELHRECTKDYQIPDTDVVIPRGTAIIIPNNSIHHDPDIYPEPWQFLPSRWTAEFKTQLHPCAYTPFGNGPRGCIGQRFALILTKACIAQLVLNYHFEPIPGKTEIPMKFHKFQNGMRPAKHIYLKVSQI